MCFRAMRRRRGECAVDSKSESRDPTRVAGVRRDRPATGIRPACLAEGTAVAAFRRRGRAGPAGGRPRRVRQAAGRRKRSPGAGGQRDRDGQCRPVPAPPVAGDRPPRHRQVEPGAPDRPRTGPGPGAALADHLTQHAQGRPVPLRRDRPRAGFRIRQRCAGYRGLCPFGRAGYRAVAV